MQRYENSAHGYSWELWCMYISPPKDWWDAGDPSLPIRYVAEPGAARSRCDEAKRGQIEGEAGLEGADGVSRQERAPRGCHASLEGFS